MRVLSITKSTGGVAAYNRTLCERLNARGYAIRVICLSEGREDYAGTLEKRGIRATSMEMERYSIAPISDLGLAFRLLRHVRREPVDVILAHGAKPGLLARLVGRLARIPAVYVLHSMPFLERVQGPRALFYRQLERLGSLFGGHIVAITHSMREELRKNRIAPASRITVIHTGIDLTDFERPRKRAEACRALGLEPGRPVVGWAGRLGPQKAPLDYVRAAERILGAVPEAQVFLAGEGPLEADVRALAERLDLGGRLITAPWQQDIPAMLAAFDVYVASSHWEGLPLAVLEAMAARRAVVATAVDGVVELIQHGVNGFLVAAGDHQALGEHVARLLVDDDLRARLGLAARKRVETSFTVDKMVDEWEEVLRRRGAGPASAEASRPARDAKVE